MDAEDRLRTMIDVFRRECHKVFQSERVTVHGADSMLMVLQLAMAEVNKQVFNTPCVQCSHNIHHANVSKSNPGLRFEFPSWSWLTPTIILYDIILSTIPALALFTRECLIFFIVIDIRYLSFPI